MYASVQPMRGGYSLGFSALPKEFAIVDERISAAEARRYLDAVPVDDIESLRHRRCGSRRDRYLRLFITYNGGKDEVWSADSDRPGDSACGRVQRWVRDTFASVEATMSAYRQARIADAIANAGLSDVHLRVNARQVLFRKSGSAILQTGWDCVSLRSGRADFSRVLAILRTVHFERFPQAYPGWPSRAFAIIGIGYRGSLYATWGALDNRSSRAFRQAARDLGAIASAVEWTGRPRAAPAILNGPPCERHAKP